MKNFLLLLFSIGISNVGAWIYLIALNLIVLEKTGSPLAVSLLYILSPIATILTNGWSGTFIDRLNTKKLMIFLNISRAILIFSLSFLDSLLSIYFIVFIINIANTCFEPTSFVYMTKLIPISKRQKFNALKNFINSFGFMFGPSFAGFLFIIGTPELAIRINAIALFISTIFLFFLSNVDTKKSFSRLEKLNTTLFLNDWRSILTFSKANIHVTIVYILFGAIIVFMTALDSLEAVFATRVLLLSESDYGFLVSIAGIGVICGSIVNAAFTKKLKLHLLIGIGACFTPIGYIIFAFSNHFIWASIGFFTITFFFSFINTGFLTFYQNNVPTNIMGRFSSVLGMIEAILIIFFTILIGLFSELFEVRLVYMIGSIAFLMLGIIIYLVVSDNSKKEYYE